MPAVFSLRFVGLTSIMFLHDLVIGLLSFFGKIVILQRICSDWLGNIEPLHLEKTHSCR